jgi:hypothetical protein
MKIVSRTAKAAAHTLHRAARKAPPEVPFSRPRRNRSAGFALAPAATATQPGEQIDDLPARQVRPQRHIAWNVGEPPVRVTARRGGAFMIG